MFGSNREIGPRSASARAPGDDSRPGVYGLRGLHAPEISRASLRPRPPCESIARDLRAGLRKGVDVIDDLDDIADAVCSVVDVAELCRNTHADARWVRAAENAYVDLQRVRARELNADRGLYLALVETHERHLAAEASLRPESNASIAREPNEHETHGYTRRRCRGVVDAARARRTTMKKTITVICSSGSRARSTCGFRRDFERGGIHLDDRRRHARACLERRRAARHGVPTEPRRPKRAGVSRRDEKRARGLAPVGGGGDRVWNLRQRDARASRWTSGRSARACAGWRAVTRASACTRRRTRALGGEQSRAHGTPRSRARGRRLGCEHRTRRTPWRRSWRGRPRGAFGALRGA